MALTAAHIDVSKVIKGVITGWCVSHRVQGIMGCAYSPGKETACAAIEKGGQLCRCRFFQMMALLRDLIRLGCDETAHLCVCCLLNHFHEMWKILCAAA